MSLIMSSNRGFGTKPRKTLTSLPPSDTTKYMGPLFPKTTSQYALNFNGSSSTVSNIDSSGATDGVAKSFTIECWLKLNANPSTFNGCIFSTRLSGGYLFAVSGNSTTTEAWRNTVNLDTNQATGQRILNGVTRLTLGIWYHVAVTYKYNGGSANNEAKIYVNGNLENANSGMSAILAGAAPVLGWEPQGTPPAEYHLTGNIDEFRYWSGVRTQEQIRASMYSTLSGKEEGLVLYYPMDEGTGSTITNLVNGNKATLNNTAWISDTASWQQSDQITEAVANALDEDTVVYYNNVLSNGGNISLSTLKFVDEFVKDLKANNLWEKIYECGVYCGSNLAAALTKLKYRSGVYMVGSNLVETDFVERGTTGGIKGNGSNKYISSGYWGGFDAQNAHIAAFVKGTEANSTSRVIMGAGQTSPSNNYVYLGWINAGAWECGVILGNASTQYVPQTATTKQEGFLCIATNGSVSQSYYANGAQYLSSVNTAGLSGSLSNTIYLLASNEGGVVGLYSTRYLRYHAFGAGLSFSEQATYYSLVARLQSRLGRSL